MKLLAVVRSIASTWFHRSRAELDLDDELQVHLSNRADDLERSGLPRHEAERQARIEFGGYQHFKEECREAMGTHFIETVRQDLGFGLRMLRHSPGFTAVAVLTLALGIGANTAVFSVVYTALLRPLPYADAGRLITLGEIRPRQELSAPLDASSWNVSYPDYLDWKRQSRAFQSIAGFSGDGFTLRGAGEPQMVFASQVTPNFFSTLGVKVYLGRDFAAGEDDRAGPHVAILNYGFWMRQFGADPGVVGRSVQLDDNIVTIVGVLPREFQFAPQGGGELWVPLHLGNAFATRRNLRWMRAIGKLAPGTSAAQARGEMQAISAGLAAAYPQQNGAIEVVMVPLRDRIIGQVRPLLLVLFGAVAFVLLIACANVANLLMVRAAGRRREFAIRSAIGARRSRLVSQLLAESWLLAVAGSAMGFLLGQWGTSLLVAAMPQAQLDAMPYLRDARANLPALAFFCAAAVLTGLAFGLAPALQTSQSRAADVLRQESRSSPSGARKRLRDILVTAEIAISLVLLVGAGLMLQSLLALLHRNPGFDTRGLLTFSLSLPPTAYPDDAAAVRFDREFSDRVCNLPGIQGIGSISTVPLTGGGSTARFLLEGRPMSVGQENEAFIRTVSTGYFQMMKIPLLAGRFFEDSKDGADRPKHVVVNQAWARRYLPGENAVGKRFRFTFSPDQPWREIVGVVANTADASLDSGDQPSMFTPFPQMPFPFLSYIVRAAGSPAAALAPIRDALHHQDPQLVLAQPLTMDEIIDQSPSVFLRRYPSFLIGSFAVLALILAMVGLYGLISYSVSQRAKEMGIRIALGAGQGDVIRLVLGEGARLVLIGIATGLAAALAVTQLIRGLLFGVRAFEPLTFAAVAILLAAVAAAACYIPARRAMRTDPMIALRYE